MNIHREDRHTFFVKPSDPTKDDYMIYRDLDGRWLCDCMCFTMRLQDDGHTPECKHIKACKLL